MLSREKIVVTPFIHGIFSKMKAEEEEICCYVLNSWQFAKKLENQNKCALSENRLILLHFKHYFEVSRIFSHLSTTFAFSNVTKAIPKLLSFCRCWSTSNFPSSSSSVKYSMPSTWLAPQHWQHGDSLLVLTVVRGRSPVF